MLYDPKKWEQKVNLDKPSLHALAYLLRHRELWPADFEWDYGQCAKCAMGLASKFWHLGDYPCTSVMARHFGLPDMSAHDIFINFSMGRLGAEITPEMIADRLEEYMETHAQN